MNAEIELDDADIRELISSHLAEKHSISCTPSEIVFSFEPGNDDDRLPWLTARVRAEKQ